MCNSILHDFLCRLPKCEHHVHIEGTLTPSLLFTLAQRNNVTLPSDDPAFASASSLLERYDRFANLDDFLGYYYTASSVLQNEQDFEDLAWAYFIRAHADCVVHAEISFDPQAHIDRGISFRTILNGLRSAKKRAEAELDISVVIICCFLRHLRAPPAIELLESDEFQAAAAAGHITGIGLDSSEKYFPPALFVELYKKAKSLGLRLTAHAGEEGPASNIYDSLELLKCERIDHGIRLADDVKLMKDVAQGGVMLTMCPLSNVRLHCVSNVAGLPLREFLDVGIRFSINSDDPAYFGGFILDNYCAIQDAFDLNTSDWRSICLASIEGSWCNGDRKKRLRQLLDNALNNA